MRLTHLLADLQKNPHPLAEINVESFTSPNGIDIVFDCDQEAVLLLKEDIKQNEEVIKDLEKDLEQQRKLNNEISRDLSAANDLLTSYKISPTDTIRDLSERNEWQEEKLKEQGETLRAYLQRFKEFEKEVETLRARKNKASVKRCVKTGKLIATFQNVEYEMVLVKTDSVLKNNL